MGRQKNVDLSIIPEDVKDKEAFKIKDQETKDKEDQKRQKPIEADTAAKTKKVAEIKKETKETQKPTKAKKPTKTKVKKSLARKAGPAIQIRQKPLHGKNYREAKKLIDKNNQYSLAEGLKILPQTAKSKFTESVEIHLKLIDKKSKDNQSIRGTIKFPHSTGKKIRIAALTEKPAKAKAAGATMAGSDNLINQIKKGKIDFDILVAEPPMMAKIAPLAKILGPKGLMPNPKSGTISDDIEATIKDLAGGKIEYKSDDTGNIHLMIGKVKDDPKNLSQNIKTLIDSINVNQIKNITICSTMGPGIKIDPESLT